MRKITTITTILVTTITTLLTPISANAGLLDQVKAESPAGLYYISPSCNYCDACTMNIDSVSYVTVTNIPDTTSVDVCIFDGLEGLEDEFVLDQSIVNGNVYLSNDYSEYGSVHLSYDDNYSKWILKFNVLSTTQKEVCLEPSTTIWSCDGTYLNDDHKIKTMVTPGYYVNEYGDTVAIVSDVYRSGHYIISYIDYDNNVYNEYFTVSEYGPYESYWDYTMGHGSIVKYETGEIYMYDSLGCESQIYLSDDLLYDYDVQQTVNAHLEETYNASNGKMYPYTLDIKFNDMGDGYTQFLYTLNINGSTYEGTAVPSGSGDLLVSDAFILNESEGNIIILKF